MPDIPAPPFAPSAPRGTRVSHPLHSLRVLRGTPFRCTLYALRPHLTTPPIHQPHRRLRMWVGLYARHTRFTASPDIPAPPLAPSAPRGHPPHHPVGTRSTIAPFARSRAPSPMIKTTLTLCPSASLQGRTVGSTTSGLRSHSRAPSTPHRRLRPPKFLHRRLSRCRNPTAGKNLSHGHHQNLKIQQD